MLRPVATTFEHHHALHMRGKAAGRDGAAESTADDDDVGALVGGTHQRRPLR
jgi:hypothetical protein